MTQDSIGLPSSDDASAYDTLWTNGATEAYSSTLEQIMLAQDKLYVVLAVVLIIWIGFIVLVLRTDKKLGALERTVEERIGSEAPESPRST